MLTVPATTILLFFFGAVLLGASMTLAGVALGAWFVFRTKREPHESLFRAGAEKGEAYVLDDFDQGFLDQDKPNRRNEKKAAADDVVPDIISKQTNRFLQQYNESKKAESKTGL
jgi:hypothetical protein